MIFAFKNDHLFRFDRENLSRWEGANLHKEPNMVYEEAIENGALKLVNQWKVDMRDESVASKQTYGMTVGKGPTLLIYPLSSGVDNRGFLIDLPSQKLTRTIVPFFNPDAAALAQQARLKVANEEWEAKQKKEAADKLAARIKANWTDKGFVRGRTYLWARSYVIMDKYDPEKDEYRLWQPQQPWKGYLMPAQVVTLSSRSLRKADDYSSDKQYKICENCEGDGHIGYTEYTTKTKELPWGYFSGIETKRISTTAINKTKTCSDCSGQGVVLK